MSGKIDREIDSASLCSLADRYENPIPTWFLAPIDCSKILAQVPRATICQRPRVDLTPMPEPTLSPSQGLRIWPQVLMLKTDFKTYRLSIHRPIKFGGKSSRVQPSEDHSFGTIQWGRICHVTGRTCLDPPVWVVHLPGKQPAQAGGENHTKLARTTVCEHHLQSEMTTFCFGVYIVN